MGTKTYTNNSNIIYSDSDSKYNKSNQLKGTEIKTSKLFCNYIYRNHIENKYRYYKIKDINHTKYLKTKSYSFDPEYTNAYMMDLKVCDIERAKYWKIQSYSFDPEYTNSYMMDQKVRDIENK
ncbi:MAG: hypothetical protein FDX30_09045 [Chlorobium sp.]|nr:MAG: hypothetical protein FDX30_09045 [Chlorobium sp.]